MGNKIVGIILAVCSGLFIGVSFVFKKKGLLDATSKSNGVAGEGYAYLKNWTWWVGMTLMTVGEICNFVAYAFTEATLVTPLGSLAVVVSAIGSSIFLKERLSFVGKVGCFLCILGAVIIVLNAPEQTAVSTIQEMQHYAISAVFLSYVGVIIAIAAFLTFWAAPRYGQKNVFVYLSICSIIGGISVVCTQGFGASIVSAISGTPKQWSSWFLWVLFIFVVCTLLTEIVFLNKALNCFNTSIVTPIYFTYFTSMTIISSAVLFRGFNGTAIQIITVVLGFFCIVAGVVLLQVSLAAQSTPDSQLLKAELNDVQEVLQMPVDDDVLNPGPASIRGALSMRRLNQRNVSNAAQINSLRRRQTLSSTASGSRRNNVPLPQYRQKPLPISPVLEAGLSYEPPEPLGERDLNTTHRSLSFAENIERYPSPYKLSLSSEPSWAEFDDRSEKDGLGLQSQSKSQPSVRSVDATKALEGHRMSPSDSRAPDRSRATSRIKKQFSFAVRGGHSTEEETIGLTKDGDIGMRDYGSEGSDDDDETRHGAI